MQNIVKNVITNQDIKNVYETFVGWENFYNKTIMVTGATGVIGSFIIRCLVHANKKQKLHIKILAVVRDLKKGKSFFDSKIVKFVVQDVNKEIRCNDRVDYIIHCASNTASASFVEKPVETLDVAVNGTKNILEFASKKKIESMVYLSSMEVYGELERDRGLTKEEDLGYIDILKPRSSYQVGKRAAEAYCGYYAQEKNVPVKIARLAQTVASNIDYNDARVFAYFARCVLEQTDIILNTSGETIRSFCYITDVVKAIFTILLKGVNGNCYNISNEDAIMTIKDFAQRLDEKYRATTLKFEVKDNTIYPTAQTNWQMANGKIKKLGWEPEISIDKMMNRVISSFEIQINNLEEYKPSIKISHKLLGHIKTVLQWIFSCRNEGSFKILTILGLKFQFKILEFYKYFYNLDIEKNKIVFNNFQGKSSFGCNPKYIAEEIIKRKLPYKLVWLIRDKDQKIKDFPKEITLVNYATGAALRALFTSQFIISNVHLNPLIKKGWRKKEEQYYLQTWHGSLGIKSIDEAKSKTGTFNDDFINLGRWDTAFTDCLLSNSEFEDNIYKNAFSYIGEIRKIGHPRNDVFFWDDAQKKSIRKKVFAYYNIPSDKKLITYCPSYRDNIRLDCYNLSAKLLLDALGEDWVLGVRLHPHVKEHTKILFNLSEKVIDMSEYSDIQEMLVASDAMITDYSSCIFDFLLSRKPGFIFATDISEYEQERGFYYPLSSTPFPVAKNNSELVKNIINFDNEKYLKDVEAFLQDKGCIEDGHASERVVDLIEEILGK